MPSALESARKFKWSSVIGALHPERIGHLEEYISGNNILDAGCGGGGYAEYLAGKNLNVVGIERDGDLLRVNGKLPRGGNYLQGNVETLPFQDKAFDCTYCFDVLEHVDDQKAIRELERVTVKRLILAVPKEDEVMHGFGLTFFHYQDQTHLRTYTATSLAALVSGIPNSQIRIFPELRIPMKRLVRAMVRGADATSFAGRIPHRLLSLLLDRVPYQPVYTGLVAIVDLYAD